jgi:hypothetical protein
MIPPALAAAGLVALFASTFAAFGVHDLIAPMTAFVALAAISAAAMALALLHGPMVALLGQAAAFAVPALVDTGGGSAFGLFSYVLAVAGGCLALARYRGWRWSAWIALIGALGWFALWILLAGRPGDETWIAVFLVALALLHLGPMIAPLVDAKPLREPGLTRDLLPDVPLIALAGAAVVLARISDYATASLVALAALLALTAIDGRWRERLDHVPGAVAIAVAFAMLAWHVPQLVEPSWPSTSLMITDVLTPGAWRFLVWCGILGAIGGVAGAVLMWGAARPWRWAALAALLPVTLFVVGYWRIEDFARAAPWTAGALALAAAYVVLAGAIARHREAEGMNLALGIVAIGATAALSLAAATLLRAGWLSVVLSLQLPAIAWIASRLGTPELRWAAGPLAIAIIARLLFNPWVLDYELGTTPILNALLYIYGVPALAFAAAASCSRAPAATGSCWCSRWGARLRDLSRHGADPPLERRRQARRPGGQPDRTRAACRRMAGDRACDLCARTAAGQSGAALGLAGACRARRLHRRVRLAADRQSARHAHRGRALAGREPAGARLSRAGADRRRLRRDRERARQRALRRRIRRVRPGPRLRLSQPRGHARLPRLRDLRRADERRRDVRLLGGVAALRRGAAGARPVARPQGAALRGVGGRGPDDPQGLPLRHGRADRRAARAVLPRPRPVAAGPRLGLPALRAGARAPEFRPGSGLTRQAWRGHVPRDVQERLRFEARLPAVADRDRGASRRALARPGRHAPGRAGGGHGPPRAA